ncbi:hypothetical protein [Microviridae sp.]|nr:hypothetical protein [Microviridae sp.]
MSTTAVSMSDADRLLVRKGLTLLAASLRRSARSALNPDVATIYDRNASEVESLSSKFA